MTWFKPSSKIFYWPFQGGTSFVDLLCFCSVLCLLCLCAGLFICALWSPVGKGLTSWLSFVVSTVSLSLSYWYPGSGVVLDCIDSWSLHPYLLIDTNAYKLQASFGEWVVVDGHGCNRALHVGVKVRKSETTKTKFLRCIGYLNSIKKQDLLLILILVRQQNFLNCYTHVLWLLKACYLVRERGIWEIW